MISKTQHHYPQISFQEEEKRLWNPILKKGFKNLPEERVRLELVEYLVREAGFSKSRISFESPVNLARDKSNSRTDLICYDYDFKPLLLVECKAPEIKLNAKVALQIARYNQQVEAPLLLVTNGVTDYWFNQNGETLSFLDEVPDPFKTSDQLDREFEYWSKRGFCGINSNPDSRSWITESCHELYLQKDSFSSFFSFDGTSTDLGLANYYRIFEKGTSSKLALALTATPIGTTKLNAILNQNGENIALLSVSLDLLTSEETQNTLLQSAKGIQQIDMITEIGFTLDDPLSSYVSDIFELME